MVNQFSVRCCDKHIRKPEPHIYTQEEAVAMRDKIWELESKLRSESEKNRKRKVKVRCCFTDYV